jgi:hypothetical protein
MEGATATMLLVYWIAQAYVALGVIAAAAFLLVGIERTMPSARGAYAFRPLLVPGLILLWPLVAWRCWRLTHPPAPDLALGRRYQVLHLNIWLVCAVLLPLLLLLSISLRQEAPPITAPIQLAPPAAAP